MQFKYHAGKASINVALVVVAAAGICFGYSVTPRTWHMVGT